jgi:nucleotide-binding universal stress UspA family protein
MSTQTQMMQTAKAIHGVKPEKTLSLTKIMVLTDFSEVSDLALQHALALARRYDARVYLTHILSPEYVLAEPGLAELTSQKMRQATDQSFGEILISGKLRGVPHETLLYEGSFWPTVERLIKKHQIDLVVTGTQGRGDFKKVVMGSVAEEVFRQADCAVLTVGPQTPRQTPHEVQLNDVLFATDFGPGAAKAARYAFSLAQEHCARLTILHVAEETTALAREDEERVCKLHVYRMKQYMPPECQNWCKVEFRVAFGAAVEEILGEARETNADLIIMGAKTSKALPGHAPLTVAYNVVAKATCPVLTVRG